MKLRYAVLAAVICGSLTACGKDANPSAGEAVTHIKKLPASARPGPSAEELTAGMVAAPTLGKSPLPADLKFELGERPRVGQALEVNLALIPRVDGGPATVQAGATDALATAPETYEIAEVGSGEVYRHTLTVTPMMEGVWLQDVKVSIRHDEVTDSQTFTLPIIVER